MGRKRALKKKNRQQARLAQELEEHYLAGRDDEFLRGVVRGVDLAAAGLKEAYGQVLDRTLRRRLNDGDVEAVDQLLADCAGAGIELPPDLPLVRLAFAVTALDAGRLEDARELLAGVSEAAVPSDLLGRLGALCAPDPAAATQDGPPALDDFCQLSGALRRHGRGELGRIPRNLPLTSKDALHVMEVARSVEALTGAKKISRKALSRLYVAAEDLREHQLTTEAQVFKKRLCSYSTTLLNLLEIERDLKRSGDDLELCCQELGEIREHLMHLFAEDFPTLRGLRHLVVLRCRAMVELLAEQGGPSALARAFAALGAASEPVMETATSTRSDGDARERSKRWAEVRTLLDRGISMELARFLHGESRAIEDPSRLVRLWGLELWALWEEYQDAPDLCPDPDEEPPGRKVLRQLLRRLRAMSRELRIRLPDEERRVQVARVLRRQLLELCASLDAEGYFDVAEILLRYLPDDAALLVLGLRGAILEDRTKARQSYEERIAAHGRAAGPEIEELFGVLGLPPDQEARKVTGFYRSVIPLLGDRWPAVREQAMLSLTGDFLSSLGLLTQLGHDGFEEDAEDVRRFLRLELGQLRPVFGEEPYFELTEMLAEAPTESPGELTASVRAFLRRRSDLEGALAVLRFAGAQIDLPGCDAIRQVFVYSAMKEAIEAFVTRLDHRWTLWRAELEFLLPILEPPQLKAARRRLKEVLAGEGITSSDRQTLEEILEQVDSQIGIRPRRQRKTTRSRRKKVRRRSQARPPDGAGVQLDLF